MAENKVYLGLLSKAEAHEIEYAIERLNGLYELLMIVKNNTLAERIRGEIAELKSTCDLWWNNVAKKYGWKSPSSSDWEIDFTSNKIWLIKTN